MKHEPPSAIHGIDLFCGIGGLTRGLELSGIQIKAGYDIDESCRYAYEANNKSSTFINTDVRDLSFHHLTPFLENATFTLIAGCAPCQPYSAHTRRRSNPAADECSLVLEFARIITEGKPDLVTMENVPGLARHPAFDALLATLTSLDYDFDHGVISCLPYGVPQTRRRLVLVASRLGFISLPSPTAATVTVGDVMRDLPLLGDGDSDPTDRAHCTLPLSKINKRRIQQSKPGGSWKDWDADLLSDCHRTAYYPGPYGRMSWHAAAPTITTQCCYYSTGRFGHPEQHRTISIREAALLQTFPRDYLLTDPNEPFVVHTIARHVGNAVPVKLAEALGHSISRATNAG